MKNKYPLLITILVLIISILGCSYYNPLESSTNSNDKTLSEKTVDKTIGEEKIGIRECDEVIEDLAKMAKNEDDDFITKAGKEVVLNKIRENLKRSIEENKKDKTQLAKDCQEYKRQIDSYKSDKNSNKK